MQGTRRFAAAAWTMAALGCAESAESTGQDATIAQDSWQSSEVSQADTAQDGAGDSAQDTLAALAEPKEMDRCGLNFKWLPAGAVGQVVSWQEGDLSNLSPATLQAMINQTGYVGLAAPSYGVRTFQLRYTTQDRGNPMEATAIVAAPTGYPAGQQPPIAVWHHPTVGFSDACAPSRDTLQGPGLAAVLASMGFVVVSPDYLGMIGFGEPTPPSYLHPYLVGEAVAVAALDGVRAAQKGLQKADLVVGDLQKLALIGASQGGHAAMFSDRLLAYYAPEMRALATVSIIGPTDLYGHALMGLTKLSSTTLALAASAVSMHHWYQLSTPLSQIIHESMAVALPDLMTSSCDTGGMGDNLKVEQVTDVYASGFVAAMTKGNWQGFESWKCLLVQNSLGLVGYPRKHDAPVLAIYGEKDNLVVTPLQRAETEKLCAQGYDIEYVECAGLGHVDGGAASLPYALRWLQDRAAGKPLSAKTCVLTAPVDCKKAL